MKFYLSTPESPHRDPIRHWRGNDFLMEVKARNLDGTPYDFTGHTFKMQIRRYEDASTIDVDIPNGSFTITQDAEGSAAGVNNIFQIQHTKADFANLLPIEYKYDIEITDAAGLVFTPIYGPFKIVSDVTR